MKHVNSVQQTTVTVIDIAVVCSKLIMQQLLTNVTMYAYFAAVAFTKRVHIDSPHASSVDCNK